jgi:hypothetical protein
MTATLEELTARVEALEDELGEGITPTYRAVNPDGSVTLNQFPDGISANRIILPTNPGSSGRDNHIDWTSDGTPNGIIEGDIYTHFDNNNHPELVLGDVGSAHTVRTLGKVLSSTDQLTPGPTPQSDFLQLGNAPSQWTGWTRIGNPYFLQSYTSGQWFELLSQDPGGGLRSGGGLWFILVSLHSAASGGGIWSAFFSLFWATDGSPTNNHGNNGARFAIPFTVTANDTGPCTFNFATYLYISNNTAYPQLQMQVNGETVLNAHFTIWLFQMISALP